MHQRGHRPAFRCGRQVLGRDPEVADSAAIATLSELGELPRVLLDRLAPLARPTVLGGGRPVGELEPRVELKWE